MDTEEFREFGKATVDYIANYYETIRDRPVLPSVEPGYISKCMPDSPPEIGESWQEILKDVDRIILPGLTHWQSPHFHAYYPTSPSFPSMVGELMSAGLACVGLSWIASPACTELEVVMMNWLGKLIGLPEEFLNCSDGPGGGIIQSSLSETVLITLIAAKEKTVKEIKEMHPNYTETEIKSKLIAYSSDQSNAAIEKCGVLGSIPMKLLKTDKSGALRGETLLDAIKEDKAKGLIPCYLVATLGTTPTCAFDNLEELGPICDNQNIWLNIDAAYAGAAFSCPEYRDLMKGIEYSNSFSFSPHKWMLSNMDCCAMWVKDANYLVEAFNVERSYIKDKQKGLAPEYRHWQISLGRRFRALKLWFVLRIYGVQGIQDHIRRQISLANRFAKLVDKDDDFELCTASMGLVCFRIKGDDNFNKKLLENCLESKRIYITECQFGGRLYIRFAVCSRFCNEKDIEKSWNEITTEAKLLFSSMNNNDYSSEEIIK